MDRTVQVDTVSSAGGSMRYAGDVAERLIGNDMSINSLRTLGVLRKEEWIQFDQAVIEIARARLGAVEDFLSRGLSINIPNAMGTTVLEWEKMSDMEPANVDMSGTTEGERDRVAWTLDSMPLPIIHKDFSINIRALEASRTRGAALDVTQASLASRLVSEKIEDILFNGHGITEGGKSIAGLTTQADRNTGSVTAAWETVGTTGEQRVGDVIAMIGDAAVDNQFGPFALYCSVAARNELNNDFKANSDRTTFERMMAIEGIQTIRGTSRLAAGVLLVQLTNDVCDIVNGFQPTTVQWETRGGMTVNFKVMAIMLPRVRSDFATQSGIVHYT